MSDFTYQRERALLGPSVGLFEPLPDATQFAHDERATGGTKRLPAPTTAQEFAEFHAENPHVYDWLVRLARDAQRSAAVFIAR